MDIADYYQHARQLKMDKDAQERQMQIELEAKIKQEWDKAKAAVRQVFPIEGAMLYESEPGMMESFPRSGGNYQLDLVLPGAKYTPRYDENRDMRGVIRVSLHYEVGAFEVRNFAAWDKDNHSMTYVQAHEAFLMAYEGMGFEAVKVD